MKFAHQSEKIFANHLDLFDIKWIYEPKSFPLKWGSGAIKMMFTPDFYLPEMDIYIEITTMDQKLITKKQRKIKLARKLYPCLLYTSPSPRDVNRSRMPASA